MITCSYIVHISSSRDTSSPQYFASCLPRNPFQPLESQPFFAFRSPRFKTLYFFPLEHWFALWFCNPLFAGSNPVEDVKAMSSSEKQHLKIDDFFVFSGFGMKLRRSEYNFFFLSVGSVIRL